MATLGLSVGLITRPIGGIPPILKGMRVLQVLRECPCFHPFSDEGMQTELRTNGALILGLMVEVLPRIFILDL